MNKITIFALLFVLSSATAAFAESYTFPSNKIKELDVIINAGTLNVTSSKSKDITISISPDKTPNTQRHIYIDNEGELNVYLDDAEITAESVVSIAVPKANKELDINSRTADVNVDGFRGELSIDITSGKVRVTDFNGKFDISTVEAHVEADGIFSDLDIETARADVNIKLKKLPSFYEYEIEGAGNVVFHLGKGVKKDKLRIDSHEFYGHLEIR